MILENPFFFFFPLTPPNLCGNLQFAKPNLSFCSVSLIQDEDPKVSQVVFN